MARQALAVRELIPEEQAELEALYDRTRDARLRTRAQVILLAIGGRLVAGQIAPIVRHCEETVRTWIKRFNAGGIEGLEDRPRPGTPVKVTEAYRARLLHVVRRRPRALGRPYSLWTLERLADFMAEETAIRLSHEGVRLILKAHDIALSRPQHKITSPDPEYDVKKKRSRSSEAI